MKFYLGNQYDASPFAIQVDGIKCNHTSKDTFPFLVLDGRVYFGKPGGEHGDLEEHLGVNPTMVAEGRFYVKPGALVFWAEDRDITPENVRLVVEALRKRIRIKPNSIRLFMDCSFDREREYDEGLIVEMTPEEYLSHNIAGKNTEYFWALFKNKNKLSDEGGETTQSGMSAKDVWRHYEYVDENMRRNSVRLNETDLRGMVAECVKKILKERRFPNNEKPQA